MTFVVAELFQTKKKEQNNRAKPGRSLRKTSNLVVVGFLISLYDITVAYTFYILILINFTCESETSLTFCELCVCVYTYISNKDVCQSS